MMSTQDIRHLENYSSCTDKVSSDLVKMDEHRYLKTCDNLKTIIDCTIRLFCVLSGSMHTSNESGHLTVCNILQVFACESSSLVYSVELNKIRHLKTRDSWHKWICAPTFPLLSIMYACISFYTFGGKGALYFSLCTVKLTFLLLRILQSKWVHIAWEQQNRPSLSHNNSSCGPLESCKHQRHHTFWKGAEESLADSFSLGGWTKRAAGGGATAFLGGGPTAPTDAFGFGCTICKHVDILVIDIDILSIHTNALVIDVDTDIGILVINVNILVIDIDVLSIHIDALVIDVDIDIYVSDSKVDILMSVFWVFWLFLGSGCTICRVFSYSECVCNLHNLCVISTLCMYDLQVIAIFVLCVYNLQGKNVIC